MVNRTKEGLNTPNKVTESIKTFGWSTSLPQFILKNIFKAQQKSTYKICNVYHYYIYIFVNYLMFSLFLKRNVIFKGKFYWSFTPLPPLPPPSLFLKERVPIFGRYLLPRLLTLPRWFQLKFYLLPPCLQPLRTYHRPQEAAGPFRKCCELCLCSGEPAVKPHGVSDGFPQ